MGCDVSSLHPGTFCGLRTEEGAELGEQRNLKWMRFNGSNCSTFAIVSFSLQRARSVTGHNISRASSFSSNVSPQHAIVCQRNAVIFWYFLTQKQIITCLCNTYAPYPLS
jgi:hypothetical protein